MVERGRGGRVCILNIVFISSACSPYWHHRWTMCRAWKTSPPPQGHCGSVCFKIWDPASFGLKRGNTTQIQLTIKLRWPRGNDISGYSLNIVYKKSTNSSELQIKKKQCLKENQKKTPGFYPKKGKANGHLALSRINLSVKWDKSSNRRSSIAASQRWWSTNGDKVRVTQTNTLASHLGQRAVLVLEPRKLSTYLNR